jgi:hypothetical protein
LPGEGPLPGKNDKHQRALIENKIIHLELLQILYPWVKAYFPIYFIF